MAMRAVKKEFRRLVPILREKQGIFRGRRLIHDDDRALDLLADAA
jgi:hypothetical protein